MTIQEAFQELAKIFKQVLDNIDDCFQRIREHIEEDAE